MFELNLVALVVIVMVFVHEFGHPVVGQQCELTTNNNVRGFCTNNRQCCRGYPVNSMCGSGQVCCYGQNVCSPARAPSSLTNCPPIISRANWGAAPARRTIASITPVRHVFIHHTGEADDGEVCYGFYECSQRLRSLQNYHQTSKGWPDIAWNFIIGGDGLIYEGVGWNREGQHTLDFNKVSLGIAFVGNFNQQFTEFEMLEALSSLLQCGVRNGFIKQDYQLHGHRDAYPATKCPGDDLYDQLKLFNNYVKNIAV